MADIMLTMRLNNSRMDAQNHAVGFMLEELRSTQRWAEGRVPPGNADIVRRWAPRAQTIGCRAAELVEREQAQENRKESGGAAAAAG